MLVQVGLWLGMCTRRNLQRRQLKCPKQRNQNHKLFGNDVPFEGAGHCGTIQPDRRKITSITKKKVINPSKAMIGVISLRDINIGLINNNVMAN